MRMVWMNGALRPLTEAVVSVFSNVVSYGRSVWEGIRVYDQLDAENHPTGERAIWLANEHAARWKRSADRYRIPFAMTTSEIIEILKIVAAHNPDGTYLRPILFSGIDADEGNGLGVDPSNCMTNIAVGAFPWGKYVRKYQHNEGASVLVTPFIRPPTRMFPGDAKGAPAYGAWSQLAKLMANEHACSEALLQGEDDYGALYVVDGSGMNLMIAKNGVILFPRPQDWNILCGETYLFLISAFDRLDIAYKFMALSQIDLIEADEVWLTGTATEVTPVTLVKYFSGDELRVREIGNGHPGPISIRVRDILTRATRGQDPTARQHLTLVPHPTVFPSTI